jgi:hypothetical protein
MAARWTYWDLEIRDWLVFVVRSGTVLVESEN